MEEKTTERKHELILVYGKVLKSKCQLILIVGREPNSDKEGFNNKIGKYCFEKKENGEIVKKCGFYWKRTHKYIGDIYKKELKLKEIVEKNENSPLIYTDVSPKPIKNKDKDKSENRKIKTKDFIEHIDKIFRKLYKKNLLKRIELIILGGNTVKKLKFGFAYFKKIAEENDIKIVETPFFINNNAREIKEILEKKCKNKIKKVVKSFLKIAKQY